MKISELIRKLEDIYNGTRLNLDVEVRNTAGEFDRVNDVRLDNWENSDKVVLIDVNEEDE